MCFVNGICFGGSDICSVLFMWLCGKYLSLKVFMCLIMCCFDISWGDILVFYCFKFVDEFFDYCQIFVLEGWIVCIKVKWFKQFFVMFGFIC